MNQINIPGGPSKGEGVGSYRSCLSFGAGRPLLDSWGVEATGGVWIDAGGAQPVCRMHALSVNVCVASAVAGLLPPHPRPPQRPGRCQLPLGTHHFLRAVHRLGGTLGGLLPAPLSVVLAGP